VRRDHIRALRHPRFAHSAPPAPRDTRGGAIRSAELMCTTNRATSCSVFWLTVSAQEAAFFFFFSAANNWPNVARTCHPVPAVMGGVSRLVAFRG